MRRTLSYALALAVLVPAIAQAQWSVGARSGYAIPMGDLDGSMKMSDAVSGQIPIQLDLDYRTMSGMTLGGYLSYGFGNVAGATKDLCDAAGQSCSSSSFRLGVDATWSLAPPNTNTRPWLGLGLGYDGITLSGANDVTFGGFELLFQGGHDWRVGQTDSVGLFASFSIAEYTTASGGGSSADLIDKKIHEWLTLGVRGAFGF